MDKKEVKQNKKMDIKKLLIPVGILIAVGIIVFIIIKVIGSGSQEAKITKNLTKMGKDFYTTYYYPLLVDNKSKKEQTEFLERFKDTGIKINIDNLSRFSDGKYKEEIESFKQCKKEGTRAIIYPKSPYGKNDYKIEVELDCGFKKN